MEVLAPAKINLFLQVTGRREDGYHELHSLMCGVNVFDRLELRFGSEHNVVHCSAPGVPTDKTNLALKAALLFHRTLHQECGLVPQPLAIHLTKHIPVGAGLGGGSSDAAAVLKGLNVHYGRPFSTQKLMELGLALGADVPFFIFGKPALASGIGEKLTHYTHLKPMSVVLIYPGFAISTAWVYKNLNLRLTKQEKKISYFAFEKEVFDATCHLGNDLETVAVEHWPIIAQLKDRLLAMGASGALMSGSGSAVFGIFTDRQTAQIAGTRLSQNKGWQIFVTEMMC